MDVREGATRTRSASEGGRTRCGTGAGTVRYALCSMQSVTASYGSCKHVCKDRERLVCGQFTRWFPRTVLVTR